MKFELQDNPSYEKVFGNDKQKMQKYFDITSDFAAFFENIQEKLPYNTLSDDSSVTNTNTKRTRFIKDVIGDFIWDLGESVDNSLNFQLDYYWEGNVNLYLNQLTEHKKEAANVVINLFIFFEQNIEEFEDMTLDEIDEESAEYYGVFGGNISYLQNLKEKVRSLSLTSQKLLNKYLSACNLKVINIKK